MKTVIYQISEAEAERWAGVFIASTIVTPASARRAYHTLIIKPVEDWLAANCVGSWRIRNADQPERFVIEFDDEDDARRFLVARHPRVDMSPAPPSSSPLDGGHRR